MFCWNNFQPTTCKRLAKKMLVEKIADIYYKAERYAYRDLQIQVDEWYFRGFRRGLYLGFGLGGMVVIIILVISRVI